MDRHSVAYQRFMEFLISRQAEALEDRDIREHVLELRNFEIRIGYTEAALRDSYPRNLNLLFHRLRGADRPASERSYHALLPGTIYADEGRSHRASSQLLSSLVGGEELLLVEQGFLASTHSWAHAFDGDDLRTACLSYVYDDISHYFMSNYPNRLIQRLNSDDSIPPSEIIRSRELISRITARRISKYNAQPMALPALPDSYPRRVLVCDQSFADASTTYGLLTEADFERMLLSAIVENPDAQVLVKSHPDSSWRPNDRKGYFSHLESSGRVRVLREPVNPYSLFELVDTVYVGSSQMGMEALLAGKHVVCFGAPFYAGWGLTEDRCSVPHRKRTRTLEEIFFFFYVWYTIYNVPGHRVPSTIEDTLHYIEANRPACLPLMISEVPSAPSVSVIIPVYQVQPYIEDCLRSILEQTLQDIEVITVNDRSTDGSQEIIDRIAKDDPRLRSIILKENQGQGFARNYGIDAARGKYIFFVDADDLLYDARVLEDCLDAAISENAEMVRVQKFSFEDGVPVRFAEKDGVEAYFSERKNFDKPITHTTVLRTWHFWNFLYSRDLLISNNIRFRTPQWEERYFVCRSLQSARRLHILPRPGVAYRRRKDSTTGRKRTRDDLATFLLAIDAVAESFSSGTTSTILAIQFANFFIGDGPWAKWLIAAIRNEDLELLGRFREVFGKFEFSTSSVADLAPQILSNPTRTDSIALLLSACIENSWNLAEKAIRNQPIEQSRLYSTFLSTPNTLESLELEAALNLYARNARARCSSAPWFVRITGLGDRPRRPRLVLHIGASKTGSTYLQHFMEMNRPALLRGGVWYPETGLFWQPVRPHKTAGHALFTRSAVKNRPYQRRYLDAGLREMNGGVHTIVLSSEAFFLQENSHQIVPYLSEYPCEVIVYLRRQDEWANSQYCEFVAGGAVNRLSQPIETWIETEETQSRMDFRTTLARFETVVPRDRIRVRVFDRMRMCNGDLIADFAEAADLPILVELPRPKDKLANDARLCGAHIQLLRQYNERHFEAQDNYFRFIEDVGNEIMAWRQAKGIPVPKPMLLSLAKRKAILDSLHSSNEQIARDWLGRADGQLFDETVRETSNPEDVVYDEEIQILEAAFERWSRGDAIAGWGRQVPQSNSPRSLSDQYRVVNYGLFGWRLWGLTPLVRAQVGKRGSAEDLERFDRDPAGYLHSLQSANYQRLAELLYPQRSVLGPGGILWLWVPPLSWAAAKLGGKKDETGLRNDPVLFFRLLRNPLYRAVGRLLFPIGEVVHMDYRECSQDRAR